jgi:hypothetical protein
VSIAQYCTETTFLMASCRHKIWLNKSQYHVGRCAVFSTFVSDAVRHFTRSDAINYEEINIKYYECVCILTVVMRHANCVFSAQYYVVTRDLTGSTVFSHYCI